jgi:hypothetical protein
MNLSSGGDDYSANGPWMAPRWAQQGKSNMLIFKAVSAVVAAALGAAVVLALPGFSPEVEAGTPAPIVKSDRLDIALSAPACGQQAWPYYQSNCLRDRNQPGGRARSVRLVSTDQVSR